MPSPRASQDSTVAHGTEYIWQFPKLRDAGDKGGAREATCPNHPVTERQTRKKMA
jgi:hypothetical protein